MLPEDYFNQLFKFAVVRNPWDLQVSSFHHIKRERPAVMQGYDDFESFMKWKFDDSRPYQYHIGHIASAANGLPCRSSWEATY